MNPATRVLLSLSLLLVAVAALGFVARRSRLGLAEIRVLPAPPRRAWGGESDDPPGAYAAARTLARWARWARPPARLAEASPGLAWLARGLAGLALASGWALLPWGFGLAAGERGMRPAPLALMDPTSGLLWVVVALLVLALARTAAALAEGTAWARLAAVDLVTRSAIGVLFLLIVLAPLVLATESLRLAEIVEAQRGSFAPLAAWAMQPPAAGSSGGLSEMRWPAWFVWRQPLTAALFVPAVLAYVRRPGGSAALPPASRVAVLELDATPLASAWGRFEGRFAGVWAAALFVVLFLGGGGLPLAWEGAFLEWSRPRLGQQLPELVWALAGLAVFASKLAAVLALAGFLTRLQSPLAPAAWRQRTLRRWIPLACANLLLLLSWTLHRGITAGGIS